MHLSKAIAVLALVLLGQTAAPAASAQPQPAPADCRNTASFDAWLDGFRKEAVATGISRATVADALDGIRFDRRVIARDRRQSFFSQSFLQFADKLISASRLKQGRARLERHRALFARVEKDYGVPGPVITALWALESDYGAFMGRMKILRSLATLAYDCRRRDRFHTELMDALRIVERGDLRPEEMIGPWAGELGQTQFLASRYLEFGVDYDGDGRRNLIASVPDVLASTANYLVHLGWQRDQPWLEEVRVQGELPWEQADLAIKHPRAKWAEWGVTRPDGRPLLADSMPAALLLPMGRRGPAFLAYPNFEVYLEWNRSLTYGITVSYLGTRLAGAPPMYRGAEGIPVLKHKEITALQRLLVQRGHDVGEVDGKVGKMTRAAVKAVQKELGLPADSYPTPELLRRLRRG